jgi:dihydropteroate synthase
MNLLARGRTIAFSRRPLIMGIVNLCADSFSGDGLVDTGLALERARQMVADGAEIIDIGGESAGTKRAVMSEAEEIGSLLPFVRRFREAVTLSPNGSEVSPPLLSINTWRPAVARAVLEEGGDLLNDIGALPTDENARICAATGAALLIMHSVGEPKVAHTHIGYRDVWAVLERFFEEKIAMAQAAGMPRDSILLDPGIDFAKQRDDNLRIYRELERLHRFGRPVLLPVSRKTVIGEVLAVAPAERDAGTVACVVSGMLRGAQIFRVHNVRAAFQAVQTVAAVEVAR